MQEPTTNAESPPTWTATSPEAELAAGATAGDEATPAPAGTPGGPSRRNLGLAALAGAIGIGVLAIGIAIGGGATSGGSTTLPAADGRPAVVSDAAWTSPDGRTRVGLDERGGHGMRDGIGRGSISITAISGSKLSLQTDDGWTRTIDSTGATITKDGATVTVSALKVGDRIRFTETRNDDGTYTITAIAVVQPSVAGTVASVSGSTVTVTERDGGPARSSSTSSTTYELAGKAATKDAVVAGVRIVATGTLAADGTLTATSVEVVRRDRGRHGQGEERQLHHAHDPRRFHGRGQGRCPAPLTRSTGSPRRRWPTSRSAPSSWRPARRTPTAR